MPDLREPITQEQVQKSLNLSSAEDVQKIGGQFDLRKALENANVPEELPPQEMVDGMVAGTESLIVVLPEDEINKLNALEKQQQDQWAKLNAKIQNDAKNPESSEQSVNRTDDKPKRKFDPEELQKILLSMIKEQEEYTHKYEIAPGHAVTLKMLSDAETKLLNQMQYDDLKKGDKEWKKVFYQTPNITEEILKSVGPNNPQLAAIITQAMQQPASAEIYVYTNPNNQRNSLIMELAMHIVSIGKESFLGLNAEQKVKKLEEYNSNFIDYLYINPFSHFREMVGEVIKNFKPFY